MEWISALIVILILSWIGTMVITNVASMAKSHPVIHTLIVLVTILVTGFIGSFGFIEIMMGGM